MTTNQINELIDGIFAVLVALYPPLAVFKIVIVPLLRAAVNSAATSLAKGIADGTIVPDGKGGFVPSTNSRYDPATGEFLK